MATYGALPQAGLADTLKEGQRLTVVGYGVNGFDIGSEPPLQPQPVLLADRSRATVRLLNTKDPDVGDQYVKTSGIGIIGGGEGSCYGDSGGDRKSTRLNSSHANISYAVFCLKKKKK